jgi:hypothetical protein
MVFSWPYNCFVYFLLLNWGNYSLLATSFKFSSFTILILGFVPSLYDLGFLKKILGFFPSPLRFPKYR